MATITKTKKPAAKSTIRVQGRAVVLEKSPVSGLYRKPARAGDKPISRAALNKALENAF